MNEEKYWLIIWGYMAIAVILMTAILTAGVCYHRKTMVENGYEETTLQGTGVVCWQKVK